MNSKSGIDAPRSGWDIPSERLFFGVVAMAERPPRADNFDYHTLILPAFPHIKLDVALERDTGKLWFPVSTICEDGLRIDAASQRAKIKHPDGEYEGNWQDDIPFESSRGWRDTFCLEFEALGHWFTSIQARRVSEDQRQYVRAFRREVWKAASSLLVDGRTAAIAEGRPPNIHALPAPTQPSVPARSMIRGRDLRAKILEDRLETLLDTLEDVVYVRSGEVSSRSCQCPYCGGELEILVEALRVVAARRGDDS
jgi:hypothetical protein